MDPRFDASEFSLGSVGHVRFAETVGPDRPAAGGSEAGEGLGLASYLPGIFIVVGLLLLLGLLFVMWKKILPGKPTRTHEEAAKDEPPEYAKVLSQQLDEIRQDLATVDARSLTMYRRSQEAIGGLTNHLNSVKSSVLASIDQLDRAIAKAPHKAESENEEEGGDDEEASLASEEEEEEDEV